MLEKQKRAQKPFKPRVPSMPNFHLQSSWPLVGVAGGLILSLAGCGGGGANKMTSFAGRSQGPHASLLSVPAAQRSQVRVVKVQALSLPRTLRLAGTVSYNAFATTPVISQLDGPVTRVVVVPGEAVRAGQPLCYVESPGFSRMRAHYLKTRDAARLARLQLDRARDLYAHHAIALQQLQAAQSQMAQSQADLDAARQALLVLGVKNPAAAGAVTAIPILAPVAGEIVARGVEPGQYVRAGSTQAFLISNLNTVWVLAHVYQRELAWVRPGETATIETDAYPDQFSGRITYIAPEVDPATRTLQVRIVTANPRQELKKGMYVTALIHAGEMAHALVVPAAAVLRNGENQPFVYREAAPNQFAMQMVGLGITRGGMTQITSGLRAGESVIAHGSLFLQFAEQNH